MKREPVTRAFPVWKRFHVLFRIALCYLVLVRIDGRSTRIRTQIDGFGDRCSTIELYSYGAENEIRTRDPHLGKVMLYH